MHNIHNCKIRASGEVRAKMAEEMLAKRLWEARFTYSK